MTHPALESIANTINYGDLPETWRLPEPHRFSPQKTLYDYQTDALMNAARTLYLYFKERENDYRDNGSLTIEGRKHSFAQYYYDRRCLTDNLNVNKFEKTADRRNWKQNSVFEILKDYFPHGDDQVVFSEIVNRMGFWMATGSGKTLVMVKLIEYLYRMIQRGEIPSHNILLLAPSDHLIKQIREAINEFNQSGLYLDLVPLRKRGRVRQGKLGDTVTVYYHRSDNISDAQKEVLIDFRRYENDGKWYVLLDEAHKGGREDSKRQAYYTVMSRQGFLFNFSATFTDELDILTTVKKYNLTEFVRLGHSKKIFLNETEFNSFQHRRSEISHQERRNIVLKSLVNLAFVTLCVKEIRERTGQANLYHSPLMLTLVNSVNTTVENEHNDLWAFFQILKDVATGMIGESMFFDVKKELINDWTGSTYLLGEDDKLEFRHSMELLNTMTVADLRETVFLSRTESALQLIHSKDNKELVFQMKNSDSPFALIRIGNTSKWRNQLLAGYEETTALRDESFFAGLEFSTITILMGSRSFFESWDSNRPNVINFINIGGADAKKFVVQSVGRGVRIEPLPSKRRRLSFLTHDNDELTKVGDVVNPVETLFLYATNRNAVKTVLKGLQSEKIGEFKHIEGFIRTRGPEVNGKEMPLLVPAYQNRDRSKSAYAKFAMSNSTLCRFQQYLEGTPNSVFIVRDNMSPSAIKTLRDFPTPDNIQQTDKEYADLSFLQHRLISHFEQPEKLSDGVRELNNDEDIVHFRKISVNLDAGETRDLMGKIVKVSQGGISDERMTELARQLSAGEIGSREFRHCMDGKSELTFKKLKIKHIHKHYYVPVVMAETGNSDYIQHIIKEESETRFLRKLDVWLQANKPDWDAWMFSKIDEYFDRIHIPYYNQETNEYSRFLPDFIFWMCRNNHYQIVFVDPKGTAHKSAYLKIDGYMHLFENYGERKQFKFNESNVSVNLLMFNDNPTVPKLYERFWTSDPADVFSRVQAS